MFYLWNLITSDPIQSFALSNITYYVLLIPAIYMAARIAFGKREALWAGLLALLYPFLTIYKDLQTPGYYNCFLLFLTLSTALNLRLLKSYTPQDAIGAGMAAGLLYFAKDMGFPWGAMNLIIIVLMLPWKKRPVAHTGGNRAEQVRLRRADHQTVPT